MQQASNVPVMGAGPERSSFGPAFLFLNGAQRRALGAFYRFARAADDIADEPGRERQSRLSDIAAWRGEIDRLFLTGKSGAAPELAKAAADFPLLKKEYFHLLLDGVTDDLDKRAYATIAELEGYMYKVASSVGLACLAIFGYDDARAGEYAKTLGYAVQLTNIMRDAAEDAGAGRIYLPAEDLARFGCEKRDLLSPTATEGFTKLMAFEAARAAAYYARARELINPSRKKQLFSAMAMAGLYEALLRKLSAAGFKSAGPRMRLGKLETAAALYRTWREYAQI
jgi:phytoene synthase